MTERKRIQEIDFLRGIAIILMVFFHLLVDLSDFYNYPINYLSGFWYYEGKLSAILFMLLSGISCTFSRSNLKRGLQVFGFGLLLTLVTYFYSPNYHIRFGILSFLGSAMVIYHFSDIIFNKLIKSNAVIRNYSLLTAAFIILILGNVFEGMTTENPYLYPLGIITRSFSSMDYYPLFPYLAFFIFGVLGGKIFYSEKKSLFPRQVVSGSNPVSYLGQHSLVIYLIHQPMLLGVLALLSYIKIV